MSRSSQRSNILLSSEHATLPQATSPDNGGGPAPAMMELRCPLCAFVTPCAVGLRFHAWHQHLRAPSPSAIADTGESPRPFFPLFRCRVFTCSQCSAVTTDASSLGEHYSQVHGIRDPDAKVYVNWISLSRSPLNPSPLPHPMAPLQLPTITITDESITQPKNGAISTTAASMLIEESGTADAPLGQQAADDAFVDDEAPASTGGLSPPLIESSHEPSVEPSHSRQQQQSQSVIRSTQTGGPKDSQDWYKLISRLDKKFSCLVCAASSSSTAVCLYNGRTEVVFHVVTRHLLRKEIEDDLMNFRCLTNRTKQRIGVLFVDGMHIRSGVHYKDAERVEAALFRSVELHLRWKAVQGADASVPPQNVFRCSGCRALLQNEQTAIAHINQELRCQLPCFMRARSCPWSLCNRGEWVWCVPDTPTSLDVPDMPSASEGVAPSRSLLFAGIINTGPSSSNTSSAVASSAVGSRRS